MKKNLKYISLAAVTALIASCQVFKKTPVKVLEELPEGFARITNESIKGNGVYALPGDEVTYFYKITKNDTLLDQVDTTGNPLTEQIGFGKLPVNFEAAIKYTDEGGKGVFEIPFGDVKTRRMPQTVMDTAKVRFELIIKKVAVKSDLRPFNTAGKDTITTPSGLKYIIVKKGDGEKVETRDKVTVHYNGFLENGDFFDSSVNRGKPFSTQIGVGKVIRGWDEGFGYLNVGDSVRLIIPSDLAYGSRDRGRIPGNSTLIFDVVVLDLVKAITAKPFNIENITPQITDSGIKIYKTQVVDDAQLPRPGQKVSVHYTGYLSDGTKFDSSVERAEPIVIILGKNSVIRGWEESLLLFREGEKGRIVIPSELAYGKNGRRPIIPPNATLVFDIELLKIW